MSYDFWVLPAGTTIDAAVADDDRQAGRSPGIIHADSAMQRFATRVAAMSERAGDPWLAGPVEGSDAGAHVNTTWADPARNLSEVVAAAFGEGLAVLDPQTQGLYDPTDAVEVEVTSDGPTFDRLSPTMLTALLDLIEQGRFPWLTIARGPGVFAQVYRGDDGGWDVEHRSGDAPTHMTARSESRADVERFLWNWTTEAPEWRIAFAFEPISF